MKDIGINRIMSIAAFLLLVSATSCVNCLKGTGDAIEESRAMGEFNVLVHNGSADVILHQQSGQHKVVVTSQENLLPVIHTTLDGSKLVLDIDGCITTTEKVQIDVYVEELVRIIHDGSGDLSGEGTFKFDDLKIQSNGSGDIDLKLSGDELEFKHSGSGDVDLKGQAQFMEINKDGSGDMRAFDFKVNEAEVDSDGSGDLSIFVKKSLEVNSDGSGDVNIKGNPKNLQSNKTGSGSLNHVD